jgi:RNA polymerase sigma-70 factor, ECF subfamily
LTRWRSIRYDETDLISNQRQWGVEPTKPPEADQHLLDRLRAGDEEAFTTLVEGLYASMVRIASLYVRDEAAAEEVVQETWLAVLKGLDRFEGRSSLKTWIYTILSNRAKTRIQRDQRRVALQLGDEDEFESAVASYRFRPASDPDWPNGWRADYLPVSWENIPEERLLSRETMSNIMRAIEALPPTQREVIRLRDVEGLSSSEVCNILSLSETNQRVILHRARSRVRQALEDYLSN